MFKISVHDGNSSAIIFAYEAYILPVVDDVYVDPDKTGNHYVVTKRLLYTSKDMSNTISVWVKKTH